MISWICVDSSIVLKLVLNEPDSLQAERLWQFWLANNKQPVAPYLFAFEVTAVIRKIVYRGLLDEQWGQEALQKALAFDVSLKTFPEIHQEAWLLATRLNRPTAYDTHYLALAGKLGCEFWTADQRLFHAVQQQLSWVHWLGEFAPP